jgi:hypothetical protein
MRGGIRVLEFEGGEEEVELLMLLLLMVMWEPKSRVGRERGRINHVFERPVQCLEVPAASATGDCAAVQQRVDIGQGCVWLRSGGAAVKYSLHGEPYLFCHAVRL